MLIGRLDSESDSYRRKRDELRRAEIALVEQREHVAALRRALPLDTAAADYALEEGPRSLDADGPVRSITLSDLFEDPGRPLILYQFMYGGAQTKPCPMCSMWIDGFSGVARHLGQWANFAIVAQADVGTIRDWARTRGWTNLRLVSSAPSSLKHDLGFQNDEGAQMPGLSVFVRRSDGALRHFYSVSAHLDDEHPRRGLDLYTPVWSLMDLMPGGRGDWLPKREY